MSAALLVARLLEPSVDEARVRRMLIDLCDRFVVQVPHGVAPATLTAFLRDEGFKGADDLQSLDASRIDVVLASRRGIPITLSIPYLMVGRALGMKTRGINFPGHFLLSADDVLIDPLDATLLRPTDIEQWLAEANLAQLGASALATASPDDMAVRMLNNIKAIYAGRGDLVAVLAIIDCQLPLVAETGPLHLERAEVWFHLGDPAAAAAVLDQARAELLGTRWEVEIDRRLRRLAGRPRTTLH